MDDRPPEGDRHRRRDVDNGVARVGHGDPFDDRDADPGAGEPWPEPLTRAQAEALRRRQPSLSPWRVVAVQAAVGAATAALVAIAAPWWGGSAATGWSVLYGAAVVVVPGALMARGTTSPIAGASPAVGAVSVLGWSVVKLAAAVAMLVLANRIVQPLVWPALLAGLVVGVAVTLAALTWRPRAR